MGELIQLAAGKSVKQWKIDKKLGEGAFGAVYKCSNPQGEIYALKVKILFIKWDYGFVFM